MVTRRRLQNTAGKVYAKAVGKKVYLLLRANVQNKIYLTKMENEPERTPFFGICPNCASTSWIELHEDDDDRDGKPIYNWIEDDGRIRHNNMKKIRKMTYRDVICSNGNCECPCVLFPANIFDQKERKRIKSLKPEERIKMAEHYLVADEL